MKSNIIIKDSHRALWYEDGVMTRLLGPAEALRIQNEAEVRALREQAAAAEAYAKHPALLRLRELQALSETAKNANARIFVGFDKHADLKAEAKALMA